MGNYTSPFEKGSRSEKILQKVLEAWGQVETDRPEYIRRGIVCPNGKNLGAKLRWHLLLAASELNGDEFMRRHGHPDFHKSGGKGVREQARKSIRRKPGAGNVPYWLSYFTKLESASRVGSFRLATKEDPNGRAKHLNEVLVTYGAKTITAETFETAEYQGPAAPWKFLYDLMGRTHPEHPREGLQGRSFLAALRNRPEFEYIKANNRESLLSEIISRANGAANAGRDHGIITCVYSADQPDGLTALASELMDRLPSGEIPWCYLPVGSGKFDRGDGRYATLVARLLAFFEGRNPLEAKPADTDFETARDVERIRQEMARTPAVVIFNGFSPATGEHAALIDYIRDEALVELLHRIVHPYRAITADPSIFLKTTIIVLGTQPLDSSKDPWKLAAYCAPSLQLPRPGNTHIQHLIRLYQGAQGNEETQIEQTFLENKPTLVSETSIWLLKALVSVGKRGRASGVLDFDNVTKWLFSTAGAASTVTALTTALISELRSVDKVATRILWVLALARTEVSLLTIRRIMWRWKQRTSDDSKALDESSLEFLLTSLSGLINVGRSEALPGLFRTQDESNLEVASYDQALWGDFTSLDSQGQNLIAYDIRNEMVRDAILKTLQRGRDDYREALEIQWLLAEMSIQQFSIISRNTLWPELDRGRFYRLLVQGLLHGFESIGTHMRQQRANGAGTEEKVREQTDLVSILPNNMDDRLWVLFGTHYQQVLERQPIWAMTRSFALDAVKIDLLDLATSKLVSMASSSKLNLSDFARVATENSVRAVLRSNDLKRFDLLVEKLGSEGNSAPYTKFRVERELLRTNYGAAEELCTARLNELGLAVGGSGDHRALGPEAIELLASDVADKLAVALSHESDDSKAREGVDLIERLGVVKAHIADDGGWESGSEEAGVPAFKLAYYYFRVGNLLPRRIARLVPFADHHLTAASSRVFVRTALKLGKMAALAGGNGMHPEDIERDRDLYFARARQVADRLARQLHPFPSERASLLVLESEFMRMRFRDPFASEKLLRDVEFLTPPERHRPRLVMRFLLERAKVYRRLAKIDGQRSDNYDSMAMSDVDRVRRMAAKYDLELYTKLANRQEIKIRGRRL